jgi:hypothetical protein
MENDSRTIVMAAWQAFASHEAERIGPFFTEDAEWLAPEGNATAVALGGPSHMIGRDGIAHFLAVDFGRPDPPGQGVPGHRTRILPGLRQRSGPPANGRRSGDVIRRCGAA